MGKSREKKEKIVQELEEKLKKAKALVLTDYRGLTPHQMEKLKRTLEGLKADFTVVKNTLLKRALTGSQFQPPDFGELSRVAGGLDSSLSGPTALLLSYADELAPLHEIAKFIRLFQLPTLKVGIIEDRVLTGEELLALTQIPSKEVLLGQLVGQLKNPIYELANVLRWNLQGLIITLKAIGSPKSKS